jgi:hypothetical protein
MHLAENATVLLLFCDEKLQTKFGEAGRNQATDHAQGEWHVGLDFALPNDYHRVSKDPEGAADALVSLSISVKLLLPKGGVAFGS